MESARRLALGLLLLGALTTAATAEDEAGLAVSIEFPGGSGQMEALDADEQIIRLVPSTHFERGWDCWWYVHITGLVPGRVLTLDVGGGVWATPDRAAVSVDGQTWTTTDVGQRLGGQRIVYRHRPVTSQLWMAWGPPLVLANAEKLVNRAARRCAEASAFELCRSRDGHPVPALRITPDSGNAGHGVLIVARQHAWESGGSWVCQGLTEWITSDDAMAAALRRRAEIVIVPIVDVDNVQRGAGGKQQKPHDHNRDWTDEPHHPEVAALQKIVQQMSRDGRFDLFIDLHNPGPGTDQPYFYLPAAEFTEGPTSDRLEQFLFRATNHIVEPLQFNGRTIRTDAHYDTLWHQVSCNWVQRHSPEGTVSLCLETPWNTPFSTTEGYLAVGRQLGQAVAQWLVRSGEAQ